MFTENREFLFGADPEIFLKKVTEKGNYFYCADGIIPGTKEKPFRVPRGHIQVDGMAAEFNIDPVKTEAGFVRNVTTVLRGLSKRVESKGFVLVPQPVAHFRKEHYEEVSSLSKVLGCSPDWDAYSGKTTPTPKPPKDLFRTGAGHIHIGWGSGFNVESPELREACIHVVKHLDTCLGNPLSKIADDYERQELYGNMGCFRPTTYGVEYRTPSNYWLCHLDLIKYTIQQTITAVNKAFKSTRYNYEVKSAPRVEGVLEESS